MIFTGLAISPILTSVNLLSCISMSNQKCKVRPAFMNINSNEPIVLEKQWTSQLLKLIEN